MFSGSRDFLFSEAVPRRCFVKEVLLKIRKIHRKASVLESLHEMSLHLLHEIRIVDVNPFHSTGLFL